MHHPVQQATKTEINALSRGRQPLYCSALQGLYLNPCFQSFMDRTFIRYLHKLAALGIIKRTGERDLSGHLIQLRGSQRVLLVDFGMAELNIDILKRPAFAPGIHR